MQAPGFFEDDFSRRLRRELDALDVRIPPRRSAWRGRRGGYYYWIARPLAIGLTAAIALGALAATVTRSPDPGRWIQPSVWMRALGVAPPSSPEATTSPTPSATETPAHPSQPSETSHGGSPEPAEPSDRPTATQEPRESPDASESPEGPGG